MTSAAEKPNPSDVPKPGAAASTAALASDGAPGAPPGTGSANGHGSANGGSAESSENGFWSAAKPSENFDDYAAEEHASKVFALWEIAPSLAQPATGASQGPTNGAEASAPVAATLPAESDVWAAAGATERMESPPIAAHQEALAQAMPVAQPRQLAQSRVSPIESSTTPSADVTGALPALPESRSTRNVLLGAVALVAILVVGSGIAMFSGPAPAATVAPPPTVAAPPTTTPPAAAPPTTTTTPAPRIAEAPVPAAEPAVAAAEPAAAPEAVAVADGVEPTVVAEVAPVPVVVAPPAAPEPPPPTMRRLRIRTIPASATLQVDGQTVANPYDGRLVDGSSHALVARAEGYVESTQTIELESNRELTLRLDRIPTPRPEPAARAARATPEPAAARTRRATTETPTAAQTARTERRAARRPASTIRPREPAAAGAGFVTESPY